MALVHEGLISESELRDCVKSEFNPIRVGFKGMREDLYTTDVLDIGLAPDALISRLRARYLAAGGALHERTAFRNATVYADGVVVRVAPEPVGAGAVLDAGDVTRPTLARGDGCQNRQNGERGGVAGGEGERGGVAGGGERGESASASASGRHGHSYEVQKTGPFEIRSRLVIDCMGHYSNIVKQARGGGKPPAMVVVVGGCHSGVAEGGNTHADLLYTFQDAEDDLQMVRGLLGTSEVVREIVACVRGAEGRRALCVSESDTRCPVCLLIAVLGGVPCRGWCTEDHVHVYLLRRQR